MKILNLVLQFGILACLVALILQGAGLAFQSPQSTEGPLVETTADGRDKRLVALEILIAGQEVQNANLKLIGEILEGGADKSGLPVKVVDELKVNLTHLAEMQLHWNKSMNRIGIRELTESGETIIRPVVLGEVTIDQLDSDPIMVKVMQDPGTGINVDLRGIAGSVVGFGENDTFGAVEKGGEFIRQIDWGKINVSR